MHIAQLETDLAAKQKEFRAQYETLSQLAEKEQRESTDEERAKLQAILDDAKKVKARIDRAKGDRAMSEELEALYSAQSGKPTSRLVTPTFQQIQQVKSAG